MENLYRRMLPRPRLKESARPEDKAQASAAVFRAPLASSLKITIFRVDP